MALSSLDGQREKVWRGNVKLKLFFGFIIKVFKYFLFVCFPSDLPFSDYPEGKISYSYKQLLSFQ